MFRSIRYQLLVSYLLLVTLGTVVLATYVLHAFGSFYRTQAREDLRGRALAVSDETADALKARDLQRLRYLAGLFAGDGHLTFRVFDDRMNLLVSSRMPPPDRPPWSRLPGMREARRGAFTSGIMPDETPGSDKLYVVLPLQRVGRRVGYLRISLPLGEFQRVFTHVQMAVVLGLLATLAGCAAISLLLARSLTEPIRQMSQFAERVGAGRWSDRLTICSSGEIGQLAAALNQMCEKLDRTEEDRREFLAAVSHELRTPATNIHVTLEALLAGADEEVDLRQRFLKAALAESERLSRLMHDLSDLARLEAKGVRLLAEPVQLSHLVTRAAEAIEPRLRERSLQLAASGAADVWVTGDPDWLLQAVMNLLDNAAKFSSPEATIRVSVTARAHEAVLVLEDEGAGIPEKDLPHIFERFYTADRSRARARSGSGLGLAIVREIVQAHHGRIEAANLPGSGARFTLRLPRAASPREAARSGEPATPPLV